LAAREAWEFRAEDGKRNLATALVLDIFRNMKTRILPTIVMTVALFMVGRAQAQSPPPSVADIKMLAKGGVSEEVILSQIRNSHAAYRLSTADILDLKDSGVSEKVIDFMINTASGSPMAHPPALTRAAPSASVATPGNCCGLRTTATNSRTGRCVTGTGVYLGRWLLEMAPWTLGVGQGSLGFAAATGSVLGGRSLGTSRGTHHLG
jgi:hypothetical protein